MAEELATARAEVERLRRIEKVNNNQELLEELKEKDEEIATLSTALREALSPTVGLAQTYQELLTKFARVLPLFEGPDRRISVLVDARDGLPTIKATHLHQPAVVGRTRQEENSMIDHNSQVLLSKSSQTASKVIPFGSTCGDYVATLRLQDLGTGTGVTWIDWELYEIVGIDGLTETALYSLKGSMSHEPTENLDNAQPEATGHCKWDGCCEINLSSHVCSVLGIRSLLDAIKRVYIECAKITNSDAWKDCQEEGWSNHGSS